MSYDYKISDLKYRVDALVPKDTCAKIVDIFDKLKNVNTDNIEPLYNVNDNNLRLRKDVSIKNNTKKDILKNVPKSKYGFYVVPKMIE